MGLPSGAALPHLYFLMALPVPLKKHGWPILKILIFNVSFLNVQRKLLVVMLFHFYRIIHFHSFLNVQRNLLDNSFSF